MTHLSDTITAAEQWVTYAAYARDQAEITTDPEERQLALEVAALCMDFGMRRLLDANAVLSEFRETEQPADSATGCVTTKTEELS